MIAECDSHRDARLMGMNSHPTLAAAYRSGLLDLLQGGHPVPSVREPSSPASGFGTADRPSIELIGYSFEVTNPFACLVDSEMRPLRLPYCVGSLLWTLAGSDDLAHLQCYHPNAKNFSDDGISLSGAFGRRLFRHHEVVNQIEAIIKRLQADPASRRTFAAICDADDNIRQTREYPCCIGLQYFLREGSLHSITYMRAQHALLILPYDAFLFMTLHCLLAARIGAAVGTYRHISGTFHIYEAERQFAEQLLRQPINSIEFGPSSGDANELADLLQFEERTRAFGLARNGNSLLEMLSSAECGSEFGLRAKLVVLTHWLHSLNAGQETAALELLPLEMQRMVQRQWKAMRETERQ